MTFKLILSPEAEEDLRQHAKAGNKKQLKKISALFKELSEHPQTGTGNPKQLKYGLSGYWSRRIDDKHRIVYSIHEDVVTVKVISALGHYGDK
jgi:toxin YoeB